MASKQQRDRGGESVRIDRSLYERVRTLAVTHDLPITWHINRALEQYLDSVETEQSIVIDLRPKGKR